MNNDSFADFVLDQMKGLAGLSCRAMFGGHGLYCHKAFFGIVYQGRLYLKTNETTAGDFIKRGMNPFQPNGRQTMKYHKVPPEILEERDALLEWARRAVAVANANEE